MNNKCCCRLAPPPPVPEDQPAEEEPFELPTLEDVARATGTLRPQPLGTNIEPNGCLRSIIPNH